MAIGAPANSGFSDGETRPVVIETRASWKSKESRYYFWKRVVDIVIAGALLLVLSPVLLMTALAVRLTSPGSVLFRQRRVGKDGKEFEMLKFRSMYHNCDSRTHQEAIKSYMAGEKLDATNGSKSPYKLTNDPRVTPIGRIIRKTSIDELPQLWNVVMGQMSMVGPRPPIPYELEYYSPRSMERLRGKPGVTGPWQVYGRNKVTFEQMVEMDIVYLGNRSILYDLKLIALTVPAVVLGV